MTRSTGSFGWLDDLPRALGITSRQISAENPSGAPGGGARAVPDPADPDLPHSAAALDLGRGWKVRPFVAVRAGATVELGDIEGPGTISQLWLTTDLRAMSSLILRCTWDDAPDPAVEAPVGAFFGIGHDDAPHTVTSLPITVGPSRGCAAYWPMPFRRRARITLENAGAIDASVVAYRIAYRLGDVPADAGVFHARWNRSVPDAARPEHVILDTSDGPGAYVGTSIAWAARSDGWWGEGEVKFFIDADAAFPSYADTGTEDYFGGAWGFGLDAPVHGPGEPIGERPYSGPFSGCPLASAVTPDGIRRSSLYRWHIPDPIGFRDRLRVTVQSLGWYPTGRYRPRDDEIASVAYWYAQP